MSAAPIQLDFPGVTVERHPHLLVVNSGQPLHVLSSAVVGGGFTEATIIINRFVDKNYNCDDPASDLRQVAASHGITSFVGMLTAVRLDQARTATCRRDNLTVCAIVTAGVSNATAAGVSAPFVGRAGTINTILLVDAALSKPAMVNAVTTATEAKTAVLGEQGVETADGLPATGTSTDAIVLACTGRGRELNYAGPATTVGYLLARAVRQVLSDALAARRSDGGG